MGLEWYDRIRDTTASTGNGTLTVSGTAPANYNTLDARYATNDTFYAVIVHQTLAQWEVSQCTYLGSNNFSRQTVLDGSSGPGTLVSFSAGTKDVAVVLPANFGTREVLIANRTYYVLTTGSDSNTGLVNTAGGAFLTLQHAYDVAATLDFNGMTVTVTVGDGTYTAGVAMNTPWVGGGTLAFTGNTTTPANCIISTTSDNGFAVYVPISGAIEVGGFKMTTATSGSCIDLEAQCLFTVQGKMEYGSSAGYHILVGPLAYFKNVLVDYAISGSATSHITTFNTGQCFIYNSVITLSNTPAWVNGFVFSSANAIADMEALTFPGTGATGPRFWVRYNSMIITAGSVAASYFPGSVAGTEDTTTGGHYV